MFAYVLLRKKRRSIAYALLGSLCCNSPFNNNKILKTSINLIHDRNTDHFRSVADCRSERFDGQ